MATLDQTLKLLITADGKGLSAGLNRAQGELRNFGATATRIFASVSRAFAAVGVSLSAGALFAGLKNISGAFDDLAKSSQKVGFTVESLSKLKYAADLSGLSFEQLESGLKIFSRNLDEGRNGSRELQVALNRLGITAKDTNEQALLKIADTFQKLPDGAEKTAIAMRLFGRSGADLVPLLNAGAEGIRELYAQAERLGIVVSGQAAKAAEDFNDNMSRVGSTLSAVGISIANQILPTLGTLADDMAKAATEGRGLSGVMESLYDSLERLVFFGGGRLGLVKELEEQNEKLKEAESEIARYKRIRDGLEDEPITSRARRGLFGINIQEQIEEWQTVAAKARGRIDELSGSLEKLKPPDPKVKEALGEMSESAKATAEALTELQGRYKKLIDAIKEGKAEVSAGPLKDVKQASVLDINRLRDQARTVLDRGDAEGAKAAERLIKRAQEINDYLLETGQITKGYYQAQADKLLEVARAGQEVLDNNPATLPVEVATDQAAAGIGQWLSDEQEFLRQNPLRVPIIAEPMADGRTVISAKGGSAEITPALASGGLINGPGTATSDSILARLSAGEFIVKAAAVKTYGLGFLERLNSMMVPRFATGGMVSAGTPVNIHLPSGQSFGLTAQPGVAKQLASILSTEVLKRGRR